MNESIPRAGQQIINLVYRDFGTANLIINSKKNRSIIIVIPGQTLPPVAFFGLPIYPDKSTICDKVLDAGYDVAYLEPIGYGRSVGKILPLYTREHMADQLAMAADLLKKDYDNVFIHGFCSTCHVPMHAALKTEVSGIILQSPLYFVLGPAWSKKYMEEKIEEQDFYSEGNIERLVNYRLAKKSNLLIGKSIQVDNWEEIFLDTLQTIPSFQERGKWFGCKDMVWDLWNYPSMHGHHGWKIEDIHCPITTIKGEYDKECSSPDYFRMIEKVKPNLISENIAPYSTHFGMWEVNYDGWAQTFIKCLDDLLNAVEGIKIKTTID
jgi:hypothetical protein